MTAAEKLLSISRDLNTHAPIQPVTVREFLSWFNARRRGYGIVFDIRAALEAAGLTTMPDFESAFMDSAIVFQLLPPVNTSISLQSNPAATASLTATLTTSSETDSALVALADPTYRISKLRAANTPPTTVNPNAELVEAITLMLSNNFSQLPVMTGERDVKGIVSWQSIGTRLALRRSGTKVRDLMDPAQEIRSDLSIFQAIPIIAEHQYVLVRGGENRITGILTSSDLNHQFQQLAEPFLQLGEIENHIRMIIGTKFSGEELSAATDPGDSARRVESVSNLSFGEYIRLIEDPSRWVRLGLPIDRSTFCKKLENVRQIRNDVMHFDPDGIPTDDLDGLREFARFLQRLQNVGIT